MKLHSVVLITVLTLSSSWRHTPPKPSCVGTSPLSAYSDRATRRLMMTLRATSVSSGEAYASLAMWRDRPSAWSRATPRGSGTGSPASLRVGPTQP